MFVPWMSVLLGFIWNWSKGISLSCTWISVMSIEMQILYKWENSLYTVYNIFYKCLVKFYLRSFMSQKGVCAQKSRYHVSSVQH